jgi:Ca-activated chloride channel family protein
MRKPYSADRSKGVPAAPRPRRAAKWLPGVLAGAVLSLWTAPPGATAASSTRLVDRGNAAYAAGKYDEALDRYREASIDAPESAQIAFDRGAAYYRKGDFAKAAEFFKQAALKARDVKLEAKSKYNLGNAAFREAQRQQDSDLKASLEACRRSIEHYHDALELDPEYRRAAENIEVVRLTMKAILDKIKKQEEEAKQHQQAQQGAQKALKQLIEKQQQALDRSRALTKRRDSTHRAERSKEIGKLASQQRQIENETRSVSRNLTKGAQKPPKAPSPAEEARRHLDQAAKDQDAAAGKLDQKQSAAAQPDQEAALKELKQAQSALKQQGPQAGGQKKQAQQGQGGRKNQPASSPQASPQQAPPTKPQAQPSGGRQPPQLAQTNDSAQDILEEEKENRERRRMPMAGGYRPVDKDW